MNYGAMLHLEVSWAILSFFLRYYGNFHKKLLFVGNSQFSQGQIASIPTTYANCLTWKNDRALGMHIFFCCALQRIPATIFPRSCRACNLNGWKVFFRETSVVIRLSARVDSSEIWIRLDEELTLATSASSSLHGGNLTLINLLDAKF